MDLGLKWAGVQVMDKTRHRSILHVLRNETDLTKERFQILAKPIVEVRFTNEKLRFIHVISQFTKEESKYANFRSQMKFVNL